MNAYDVSHLTKIYNGQAMPANDDVSLHIESGEVFGLFGDNGAGKSTLIKQMVNLLKPTSGEILLFGKPLNHTPYYTPGQIGYMPQSGLALNTLTVSEALYFTNHLRGLSRSDARRAHRLPDIVNTVSHISPATYAASALRQVILGTSGAIPLVVDLLVLLGIAWGLLWVVGRRMDWRQT